MGYLVLARKWRPQAFADMTGQEHVVVTLRNAIEQNRVAHAFLFCGPRGVGKTTAARLLARALNCEKGPTASPCGSCRPCVEIAQGNSVDVAEIDGASNNGVDNVRQLRENATYLPQRDRHKIYIIDEVHMLSTAAFNALLKTLEEPPPHVKFIFATTEPEKLPDTILSRCQRHNFRRISAARMMERLRHITTEEGASLSDASLALVVRQSDGGMRDALSLLDQVFSAAGRKPSDEQVAEALGVVDRTAVYGLAESLVRRDGKRALAVVEEVYNRGVELKRLTEELALVLRHLFVTRALGEAPPELADVERKAMLALSSEADGAQLARLFDLVHGAVREVSHAAQPRLALEVALLKAIHLAPSAAIPELLRRAEELCSRLGASPQQPADRGAAGGRPPPSTFPGPLSPPAEARLFAPEPSPGGCASGECLPPKESAPDAPLPSPVPRNEGVGGDDPSRPAAERFRAAVDAVRASKARMAASLAHGQIQWIRDSELCVGFAPTEGFHRAQVDRQRAELEAILSTYFGRPTRLRTEASVKADAPASPARQAEEEQRERKQRLAKRARESGAVQSALKILGGTVEEVRVLQPEPELAPLEPVEEEGA